MTLDSVQSGTPVAITPRRRWRRVPRRFFAGTILLYALVLGTYLLALTSLHKAIPNWRTVVPLLAFAAFYVCSGLFLLILGRGHVSRWDVLKVVVCTFVLTNILCVSLRAQRLHDAMDPSRTELRHAVGVVAETVQWIFSGDSAAAKALELSLMLVVEEAIKLLPVFILIAAGRLRTAHDAMLCGALSGLTFGVVEAVGYGYLDYPAVHAPITTYLTRFFVMAPVHGVWDALAAGLVFFLSGRWRSNNARKPGTGAYLFAFALAVVFHSIHNSLQTILWPATQIATVFALLAPLYLMSKIARRRAEAMGQPQDLPFIGDLHLLMISMSTMFLAASVAFCFAMGLTPQLQL